MLLKAVRNGLGQVIIFADWLTRPKPMKREVAKQVEVDEILKGYSLYQFRACLFCIKVRRTLHKLNLSVILCDAKNDSQARQALAEQGGKIQVPCLRIEQDGKVQWLYESKAIIEHLNKTFAAE